MSNQIHMSDADTKDAANNPDVRVLSLKTTPATATLKELWSTERLFMFTDLVRSRTLQIRDEIIDRAQQNQSTKHGNHDGSCCDISLGYIRSRVIKELKGQGSLEFVVIYPSVFTVFADPRVSDKDLDDMRALMMEAGTMNRQL